MYTGVLMTVTRDKNEPRKLPMMPIRDMVIFPYMMTPFVVGRESSVRALEEALSGDRKIFLATQHDASIDEPKAKDIYQVGSICSIVQSVKMPDGNIKVLVEGVERAKSLEVTDRDGFFVATVRTGKRDFEMTPAAEQLMQRVTTLFENYVKLQQSLNYETIIASVRMDEPAKLSDTIAANLQVGIEEKQELLAIFDPAARLARIADVLDVEIEKLDIDRNIQSRVKRQMERAQKEYYLNEKIKAIQKELGRGEKSEFDELRKKIDSAGMPKDVLEKCVQELKKLEAMPPMSAESTVSRNYIDWLLAVPWKKRSKETRSIDYAEKVLNTDHYGLEKIKERILEFLAVRQLVKNPKGSILCFVGPPGVGKTSLGMSIAKATGRKFVRLSLGGVRDEAEIRGHRRTYIGAMPGQIIQHMKRAGTKNPVFLLDEVDKISSDFRGDPASALLEVLDPEQNVTFQDHYLDVDYDLSQVLFVATANVMHTIPAALQDRMEVLRLQGYTEQEKLEIARQYLVKKQRQQTGLSDKNIVFSDYAILEIIAITRAKPASAISSAKSATSAARSPARWSRPATSTKRKSPARTSSNSLACPGSATPRSTKRVKSASSPVSRGLKSAAASSPLKSRFSTEKASSPSPASSATSCRNRRRPHSPTFAARRMRSDSRASSTATSTSTCTCLKALSPRTARPPVSPWPLRSPARSPKSLYVATSP